MKKIILLVAAVLMAASTSFAQFALGGRGAINFGTIYGDDTSDIPWGFGFNAGLATKIAINDMFAIAPEATIDLRRASDAIISWSTWAIDIPVLARINVMPQLFLEVGPQISILLSSEEETDLFGISKETINFGDAEMLNTIEFSVAAGVGYAVAENLDVNFRMVLGLTSMLDDGEDVKVETEGLAALQEPEDSMSMETGSVKTLQFQVGVTYWFM
ncbi:porin family protein [Fibrobacter sp. UBA4309]|uniref:porin family protein n=1 Tax=Fibrobacter sp. UBA4309 TaxID=1946537 RepID=UPI0025BF04D7|nr:porin family protein [Fibrobacter sp. UBA4309]